MRPRYDIARTYDWNYDHAPEPVQGDVPPVAGTWDFCGLPVASPLGVAAGPLLNGRWVLYYASLGFDVLTYKTVRTRARACYELPNLQPVAAQKLSFGCPALPAASAMQGSWAVSFGMPSRAPEVWRADVEATRKRLPPGKVLSVSIVGTVIEGATLDDLAADYALAARWAVESGADVIEANFSCPNVATADGQLYLDFAAAETVAARLREAIGRVSLVIKIGHVWMVEDAARLLRAVGPYADALSMVNCISAQVVGQDGERLFGGAARGIAGEAIRSAAVDQVALFADVQQRAGPRGLRLIGVGGASTAEDVRDFLAAGAHAVHLATAAMLDPEVALRMRAGEGGSFAAARESCTHAAP
jgi:dihydroorotate dehydrogenase (NAD+) catalytic subunit